MNISLSKEKNKKEKFAFGLNSRREGAANSGGQQAANVFGGDDSEDEEEEDSGDDRAAVNRDLKAEQEALRKRAAASIAEYDYDGVYDEMHASTTNKPSETQEKKSRYIGDLLKAAKQRDRERDVINERKVAKEQAQEEAEYRGKDKFVTKAYKQKLAERELWAQEQEERRLEEEKEDVTKKTGDGAFASFYGNLNRNVAMGGGTSEKESDAKGERGEGGSGEEFKAPSRSEQPASGLGFMDGFERASPDNGDVKDTQVDESGKNEAAVSPPSPVSMRKARQEKLAKARVRYFQRQGITEEMALQKQ